jgi:hypothetical protein
VRTVYAESVAVRRLIFTGPLDEEVDRVRRIPLDLRDEKCFSLVQDWTAEYVAHSTCSKPLPVKLPENIIEIPADPAVAPRLCSSNGRSGSYVILSYCSGDFETSTQRGSGNTEFSAPLDGASLPKTLADAIEIARKLGYQYLWTRTLCTSREEWASDPARIAEIYGQAALMLSAEVADDAGSGIFHDRRVFYSPALGRNKDKYLRQRLLRWTSDIEESPLGGRGWEIVERMLAPRILHVTRRQLMLGVCFRVPVRGIWNCRRKDRLRANSTALRQGSRAAVHRQVSPRSSKESWWRRRRRGHQQASGTTRGLASVCRRLFKGVSQCAI